MFGGGGSLLLSGDDLEFWIRGLAPASGEFPDLCPARTQPAHGLGLRRARGHEHNGMGGGGTYLATLRTTPLQTCLRWRLQQPALFWRL
ncbi:hypothetical protein C8R44DRAFT_893620 [Mycena epipterygia]|nr:hypothetical protein C8R44DRAFT_893620 [Mycena epipterygia]